MTPQLNLSETSLIAQPVRTAARRATQQRAQSQQLSASFDEQLRKKHHIGSDDNSKTSTGTEAIVARSPVGKQVGENTKLGDGDDEETEGALRSASKAQPGESDDQVEESLDDPLTPTSAASEGQATEAGAASETQVDAGQPIVVADLRPVTMRSLNRLLLQGERPQKLVDESDVALDAQPSVASEATGTEAGRADVARESTVNESHPRSDLESTVRDVERKPDDQRALSPRDGLMDEARSSRKTDSHSVSDQAKNHGRAAQESSTIDQPSKQPPIALPVVGATSKAGEGATAESARTIIDRDPLISLRGLDRIPGDRAIDRAGVRHSSRPTPSRAENAEASFAMSLTRGVAAAIKQGSGSITLRLRPEALGQLKINIDLRTDRTTEATGRNPNMVSAHFEASTAEAKALLIRAMPSLREALFERGLEVQSLEVAVAAADEALSEEEDRPPDIRVRSGTRNARALIDSGEHDGDRRSEIYGAAKETSIAAQRTPHARADPDDVWVSLIAPMDVDDGPLAGDAGRGWIVGRGGNARPYQIAIEDGGAARVVVDAIA